jgi:hypothetical protein
MISPALAETIADQVQNHGLDEEAVSALRKAYPELHFTYCMDDDITAGRPVAERPGFNIYLVDGREHCLCLTADHDVATGLVLAETVEDE